MHFPRNWEFGSALSKLLNFGEAFEPTQPPPHSVRHWMEVVVAGLKVLHGRLRQVTSVQGFDGKSG
jgi:hypothetical protein